MNTKRCANYLLTVLLLAIVLILQVACDVAAVTPPPGESAASEWANIDALLEDATSGNIAYNTPASMELGETVELQMLLSPSLSPDELEEQITESGTIISAPLDITPQMKAVLKSADPKAFRIEALHDSS